MSVGTFIYDKFPVPAEVTELSLVHIDDWNINCCPGEHLKRVPSYNQLKFVLLILFSSDRGFEVC